MGKLQNAFTAGAVYGTAIALLYGFTAVVSSKQVHWGGGMLGRRTEDVMSDAPSLAGGSERHGGFKAYTEKATDVGETGIYGPRTGGGRVKKFGGAGGRY